LSRKDYENLAIQIAQEYNINPAFFSSLIEQESNWDPMAVSHAGAQGLTQVMPLIQRHVGIEDPHDAEQNMRGSARFLDELFNKYGDDPVRVLAAYNAGEPAVNSGEWKEFGETTNYVDRIINQRIPSYIDRYERLGAEREVQAAPVREQPRTGPVSFDLPDGTEKRIPDDLPLSKAKAWLENKYPKSFEIPSGFGAGVLSSIEDIGSTFGGAFGTTFAGDQEDLERQQSYYAKSRERQQRILPDRATFASIKQEYEEDGIWDALGETWDLAKESLGSQVPIIGGLGVAHRLGSSKLGYKLLLGRAGSALAARALPAAFVPFLPAAFSNPWTGAAAGLVLATAFAYSSMLRDQAEEAESIEEIKPLRAAAFAAPHGAMEYIGAAMTGVFGPLRQSIASSVLKDTLVNASTKSGRTAWGAAGKQAAKSLSEFPTELAQTVIERAQAGESISLDDATFVNELIETAAATAPVVIAFGGYGGSRAYRNEKSNRKDFEAKTELEKSHRKNMAEARQKAIDDDEVRAKRIFDDNVSRYKRSVGLADAMDENRARAAQVMAGREAVEYADVVEALDSRGVSPDDVLNLGTSAFIFRNTDGRARSLHQLKDSPSLTQAERDSRARDRRKIHSIISGMRSFEYADSDSSPLTFGVYTEQQFDDVIKGIRKLYDAKGTKKTKRVNTDTVRKILNLKNNATENGIAGEILNDLESRGFIARDSKSGFKISRDPGYNDIQYREVMDRARENGRLTRDIYEEVTNNYDAEAYGIFTSDAVNRRDLNAKEAKGGNYIPTRAEKGIGEIDVTVEETNGYYVRDEDENIVGGATNKADARAIANRLKHRSRSYSVQINGQNYKTYKNKKWADNAAADLAESDPGSVVNVESNPTQTFKIDQSKTDGFKVVEKFRDENGTVKDIYEDSFNPTPELAEARMQERAKEYIPGESSWDMRSERRRQKFLRDMRDPMMAKFPDPRAEDFGLREEGGQPVPAERETWAQLRGKPLTERDKIVVDKIRADLDAAGLPEIGARITDSIQSGRAAGAFTPSLRTIKAALDKLQGADTEAQLDAAINKFIDHEIIHAIRNLDLFTENEWKALVGSTARIRIPQNLINLRPDVFNENTTYLELATEMYKDDIKVLEHRRQGNERAAMEVITEEAVAEMYQGYKTAPSVTEQIKGETKSLLDKIRRFFERLYNSINGVGYGDAGDVFSALGTGVITARERDQIRTIRSGPKSASPGQLIGDRGEPAEGEPKGTVGREAGETIGGVPVPTPVPKEGRPLGRPLTAEGVLLSVVGTGGVTRPTEGAVRSNPMDSLPEQIRHEPVTQRFREVADSGRYDVRVEIKNLDYSDRPIVQAEVDANPANYRFVVHMEPKLAPHWKEHPNGRFVYDDRISELVPTENGFTKVTLKPNSGYVDSVPFVKDERYIYRGVSYEEIQSIQREGKIESTGSGSFESQQGQTSYTRDPATAGSYGGNFSAWDRQPSDGRPGYVIKVKSPEGRLITDDTKTVVEGYEVGVRGPIAASEIESISEIRPLTNNPGNMEIVPAGPGDRGSGWHTGSGSAPGGSSVFGKPQKFEEFAGVADTPTPRDVPFIHRVNTNPPQNLDVRPEIEDRDELTRRERQIANDEIEGEKLSIFQKKSINPQERRLAGVRSYEELVHKMSPGKGTKTWFEDFMEMVKEKPLRWFRQKFIDKYDAIARLTIKANELREARGWDLKILADVSASSAAYLSDRANGVAAEAIMSGQPVYKGGITQIDYEKPGLWEILQDVYQQGLLHDWHAWMLSKREIRLDKKEGKVTATNDADRQLIEEHLNKNPEMRELFERTDEMYQGWNENLVNYMVATGVVSKDLGEVFKRFGDYIPFYREYEGEAHDRDAEGMQTLLGQAIEQLQETIDPNTGLPIIAKKPPGSKQTFPGQMFGSLTGVKGSKRLKGGEGMVVEPLEAIMRNLQAALSSGMKNVAGQRTMQDAILVGQARKLDKKEVGIRIVTVRQKGEDVYYEVEDPLLFDSISGIMEARMPYLSLVSMPSNVLRELVTRSPGFITANLMRDTISTWVSSGTRVKPFIGTLNKFFKGGISSLEGADIDPTLRKLLGTGQVGGYDHSRDPKDLRKSFNRRMREQGMTIPAKNAGWSDKTIFNPMKKIWNWAGDVTTKSDAATRMAVYEDVYSNLISKGHTIQEAEAEAIFQAGEIINFSRRGNSPIARFVTAAIPFLNARVQGLDVLYRAGRGRYSADYSKLADPSTRGMSKSMLSFYARGLFLSALTGMYVLSVHDEDEWDKLSEEAKDDNWLIPTFGNLPGFKLPIPFEIGIIYKVIPERFMRYFLSGKSIAGIDFPEQGYADARQTGRALKRALFSTFELDPRQMQAIKPFLEASMNYSVFAQRQLIPEHMKYYPDSQKQRPGSNALAILIGETFNASPILIEHVLKGYTGTVGTWALTASDYGIRKITDMPERPEMRADQMLFGKRFLQTDLGSQAAVNDFYQFSQSVKEIYNDLKDAMEKRDTKRVREIKEEYPKVVQINKRMDTVKRRMSKLRKVREENFLSDRTREEKAKREARLDKKTNALLRDMKKYRKAMDLSLEIPFFGD